MKLRSGPRGKGRQLGWVTVEGTLIDAYRMLLTTRVGDRVVWLLAGRSTFSRQVS